MCDGFITLSRKLQDWEWHDDPLMVALWVNLLLTACHKDIKWHGVNIGRGQLLTTRSDLAEMTGLTEQQIRTRLAKLEQDGSITRKSTNKFTLITICKYDEYQTKKDCDNHQVTNNQPTNNQQVTNTDHNNNDNNKYYTLNAHARDEVSRSKEVVNGNDAVTEDAIPELTDSWMERIRMMVHQHKGRIPPEEEIQELYEKYKSQMVDPFLLTTEQDWWQHFKNWILKQETNGTDRTVNRQEQHDKERQQRLQDYAEAARGMPEYFSAVSNADGIM